MHCVQASYLVGAAVGTALRRLPRTWAFILVSCNEPRLPGGERTAAVDPNRLCLCQRCLPRGLGWRRSSGSELGNLANGQEYVGKDLRGWRVSWWVQCEMNLEPQ